MTEEIRLTTEVLNCDYFNRNRGFNCYKGKNCTEVPDCYYRQLKRLEQENKELKEQAQLDGECIDKLIEARDMYAKALEEIREKLKYWETYFCDNCPFQNKDVCDKNEKDIRNTTCTSVQLIKIQDKINEVLQ